MIDLDNPFYYNGKHDEEDESSVDQEIDFGDDEFTHGYDGDC